MVDEFRIGTESADVTPVPEPATMNLLGIGGLLTIRRRRR
ncbi:MAG: PEP-CTERM sorting domain-containing protein [Phycisphaerae bacterium]